MNHLVPPHHPVNVLVCDAGDVVEDPAVDALRQEPVKLISEPLVKLSWEVKSCNYSRGEISSVEQRGNDFLDFRAIGRVLKNIWHDGPMKESGLDAPKLFCLDWLVDLQHLLCLDRLH